ncbi:MAG: acylphosphatase [Bacteroidales bacterium]
MKKAFVLTVRGRVQRVGFRYYTQKQAKQHNISGYVKNQVDGSVYIYAEGEEKDLDGFILACKKGPMWSRVDDIDIAPSSIREGNSFSIK